MIVLALPETARPIVGNGSIPATGISRTLLSVLLSKARGHEGMSAQGVAKKARLMSFPNPLASLRILLEQDLFILLLCNGIYYAAGSCAQASLSSLFIEVYRYKELQAGLIYLPFGFGGLAGVYVWGEYRNHDPQYSELTKP
jgi:hypothetical protein